MSVRSRQITLVSVLGATYALLSYLPISVYIGGEALITANILILPVIAYLLDFKYAIMAAFIGGLAMYFTNTSITPVYGTFTVLIPVVGVLFGVLTKGNAVSAIPWATLGTVLYILYSGGTPLWLIIYGVAIISNLLTVRFKQLHIANCCISTTISELILMDIGSIFLLEFPGFLWLIILPFAIYERTVAVLGSTAIIKVLTKYAVVQAEK